MTKNELDFSKVNYSKRATDYFLTKFSIPEDEDECWVWQGFTQGRGASIRGYIRMDGMSVCAARLIYELVNGTPEKNVKHTCGNTLCINPKHLADATTKISRYR